MFVQSLTYRIFTERGSLDPTRMLRWSDDEHVSFQMSSSADQTQIAAYLVILNGTYLRKNTAKKQKKKNKPMESDGRKTYLIFVCFRFQTLWALAQFEELQNDITVW